MYSASSWTSDVGVSAFKLLESSSQQWLQGLVYLVGNLLGSALAIYKCQSMGLLPTHSSDWLAFIEPPQVNSLYCTVLSSMSLLNVTHTSFTSLFCSFGCWLCVFRSVCADRSEENKMLSIDLVNIIKDFMTFPYLIFSVVVLCLQRMEIMGGGMVLWRGRIPILTEGYILMTGHNTHTHTHTHIVSFTYSDYLSVPDPVCVWDKLH